MSAQSEPAVARDARVAQLTRELAEANEQLTATSQVLEVIGRSDFRLEPVFEMVVRHAVRLCGADCGYVYQPDGDVYRVAFIVGGSPKYREYMERHPVPRGPETLVGRVGLERRIVQIPDVLSDPAYRWPIGRELGGYRTMLGVPMLVGDRVVGVLVLWRLEVDPFGDRTIELLTTLAAQAAIAIQNVELFQQLTRSAEELRALGEISEAVSSTLDLDEVLTTIVARAVQLSGAEGGSIFEYDQTTGLFTVRTCAGTEPSLVTALEATRIHISETFLGRTAASGEPQQVPDLRREPPDPHIELLASGGWRSMLAVPLLWEQEIIGALLVRRKVTGPFTDRTAELLETLASQSAVAIHNARVFRELQDRSRQLEIASRHKSEFLASMSHELRTPLNAVIGFSDVLLERMFGDLNDRQDEYIRDIRHSGRHLLELINEILDLSKVEAGRMELELAPVSISQVLEDGVAMVRERAARERISVTLEADADIGFVMADKLKLKQVVLNLLTNAVKFTDAGGTVHVSARRLSDGGVYRGARHRHRHRRFRAGAHLRGVPARRARRPHQHGRNRPRPDALETDRGTAWRPYLDGESARRGQRVWIRHAGVRRRTSTDERPGATGHGRRHSGGRATGARSSLSTTTRSSSSSSRQCSPPRASRCSARPTAVRGSGSSASGDPASFCSTS